MAYALLATSYSNLGERSRAGEIMTKAYELRERVSEREKYYIESYYHDLVTGDLDKARQVYELWARVYPRDDRPVGNLGLVYGYLGQYERSLEETSEALRRHPESSLRYANLVQSYTHLNRLDEAHTAAEKARSKNLDSPFLCFYSYRLAFLQHDAGGMARQVAWSADKPGVRDMLLGAEADTAAFFGRLEKAREFSLQAVASAQQVKENETAAGYEDDAALWEALFGNLADARRHADAALALSNGRDVTFGAALALGFAGETLQTQKLADGLAKRFPGDTLVSFNYLPTIRAQLAVNKHDSAKAIEILSVAIPFEFGQPGDAAFTPSLYAVYVRGQAYLAAQKGNEGAAEFQKILDHRGVVTNEPIAALAGLGIARACTARGDTSKARAAYQDFFTFWKDADPNIPILKEAKAEYTKLQ
jgi:tetratricopeptide (TPR) repeat protein